MSSVERRLLLDMACATTMDPSLSALVGMRPHTTTILANQAVFLCSMVNVLKQCSLVVSGGSVAAVASSAATDGKHRNKEGVKNSNTFQRSISSIVRNSVTYTKEKQSSSSSVVATPLQTTVAVLGGNGSVGRLIVNKLLDHTGIHPSGILIVTRQKESTSGGGASLGGNETSCGDYGGGDNNATGATSQPPRGGVRYTTSVEAALLEADVLIICVLPAQLPGVAKLAKGKVNKKTIVFSTCCGIGSEKLCTELDHPLCLSSTVDLTSLSRSVSIWAQEDAATARRERMQYATAKSSNTLSKPPPDLHNVADDGGGDGEYDPIQRRSLRRQEVLDLSVPQHQQKQKHNKKTTTTAAQTNSTSLDGGGGESAFFNRIIFCLTSMMIQRRSSSSTTTINASLKRHDALNYVWSTLFALSSHWSGGGLLQGSAIHSLSKKKSDGTTTATGEYNDANNMMMEVDVFHSKMMSFLPELGTKFSLGVAAVTASSSSTADPGLTSSVAPVSTNSHEEFVYFCSCQFMSEYLVHAAAAVGQEEEEVSRSSAIPTLLKDILTCLRNSVYVTISP